MGHNVKWVMENLGITRKALINYEKEGVMPKNGSRDPKTNYRDYSDDDIERIWCIKLLQGVGFTVKEIKAMIDNPDTDFYVMISKKVTELERKREEITQYIEFAKSIKITGRIPTVSQVGSTRFEDFMGYVRENWNLNRDPSNLPLLDAIETVAQYGISDSENLSGEQLVTLLGQMADFQATQKECMLHAYFSIIGKLYGQDYRGETVQTVVKLLYEFVEQDFPQEAAEGRYNVNYFVRNTVIWFLPGSDIYLMHSQNYGADGCRFIAEAIAYFGGYETLNDFEQEE